MRKIVLLIIILHMLYTVIGQQADSLIAPVIDKQDIRERTYFYTLGDKRIALKKIEYGSKKDIVMISLHDDETTSVKAAEEVLKKTGGILIKIENKGERYITFTKNKKRTRFDPNRIFTAAGIKATLREQNKRSREASFGAVHGFARFCLSKFPPAPAYIALHNNDDNGLSVFTYLKGKLEKDASAVHQNDSHDPNNFFLTTDRKFFRLLRASGYNVVLQHNKRARDDGSLSIYYGRKNKRYINIEALEGKVDEQKQMIETVAGIIRSR